MAQHFRLGEQVYYVPKHHRANSRYIPITSLHHTPVLLLTLADQMVISPKVGENGIIAEDHLASFWVSKEAFEASKSFPTMGFWRRVSVGRASSAFKAGARR